MKKKSTSVFYKESNYDRDIVGEGGEVISKGTVNAARATIEVDRTTITAIPESEAANFTLTLKNESDVQIDNEFLLYVDPTTLNGLETNVDENGTLVFLRFDEPVEFPLLVSKPSALDVYDFSGN